MIEILYRDDELIVIAKPSGMPTHPSAMCRERDTALAAARAAAGRWVYPVHRLDRGTSGVLAFALSPAVARLVQARFIAGEVEKRYLAIVRGHAPDSAMIDKALQEDDHLKPMPAKTAMICLSRVELPWPIGRYATARYSLVEARPHTGRHRQIRKHLRGLAHPIVGDTALGDGAHNLAFRERLGVHRLLLHAAELAMPHPRTGEIFRFSAPPDAAFACAQAIFSELRQPRSSDRP